MENTGPGLLSAPIPSVERAERSSDVASTGSATDSRNLTSCFHRLTERAGLGRRRFHPLRHSAITLALAQARDLAAPVITRGKFGCEQIHVTTMSALPLTPFRGGTTLGHCAVPEFAIADPRVMDGPGQTVFTMTSDRADESDAAVRRKRAPTLRCARVDGEVTVTDRVNLSRLA
jgi:hypothetical protein